MHRTTNKQQLTPRQVGGLLYTRAGQAREMGLHSEKYEFPFFHRDS